MTGFGSDQIRCSLIQDHSKKDSINYSLTRLDGTILDEIDIGHEDWPHHWPKEKKFFSWKFLDHTPDMRFKVQRTAFQTAFNSVEKLTQLKIDFEANDKIKTDITVEWLEDIKSFDNKLSVLAHAYLYYPGSKKNGVMEFNDSPQSKWYFTPLGWPVEAYLVDPINFTKGQIDPRGGGLVTRASQPTVQIAMHELGHLLFGRHDLLHPDSLMAPFVKPGYIGGKINQKAFYWDNITSIPRMNKEFGSSDILTRTLARWRGRRIREKTYRRFE